MPFSLVQRLLLNLAASHRPAVPRRAGVPPRWPWRRHAADLEATREAFRDVVCDLDRLATTGALERVRLARSMQQLWHLRAEMFSLVARHRDQAEAEQRLAELDRHFCQPERRSWGLRARARDGGASLPPS